MRNNFFIKILTSLPVILVALYFLPFLGICLTILKLFVSRKNKIRIPIYIIIFGLLILIPKLIGLIEDSIKLDLSSIPYLNDIINSKFYNNEMIDYSKYLIYFGVISLIIFIIFKTIFEKISRNVNNGITKYIQESQKQSYEISKKNESLNNGICPSCGNKLVPRQGKYGNFLGCSNYPNCRFTK
mgnify:CR=1 FL=1